MMCSLYSESTRLLITLTTLSSRDLSLLLEVMLATEPLFIYCLQRRDLRGRLVPQDLQGPQGLRAFRV